MEWVHVVLAVGCLALGVLHLARLLLMRGDRVGEASHAAMGVGMAAMYSPLGDPVPDDSTVDHTGDAFEDAGGEDEDADED